MESIHQQYYFMCKKRVLETTNGQLWSLLSILSQFFQRLVKKWGHLKRTTAMKNSVMQTIHCETIVNLGGILLFAKVKIDEQKTMSCVFFEKSFVSPIFSFFYNDDIGGGLSRQL